MVFQVLNLWLMIRTILCAHRISVTCSCHLKASEHQVSFSMLLDRSHTYLIAVSNNA